MGIQYGEQSRPRPEDLPIPGTDSTVTNHTVRSEVGLCVILIFLSDWWNKHLEYPHCQLKSAILVDMPESAVLPLASQAGGPVSINHTCHSHPEIPDVAHCLTFQSADFEDWKYICESLSLPLPP